MQRAAEQHLAVAHERRLHDARCELPVAHDDFHLCRPAAMPAAARARAID